MGFFSAWVLCLYLLPFSLAQECNHEFYIASQADADNVGRDCPIVNTSVFITGSYTGSLVLNRVRNITEAIRVSWWDSTSPQLTSVELPDLEFVDWIDLPELTASKFSAPKLERINYMHLGQAALGSELDFPSLATAEQSLIIIGNYSSVNLASLKTVKDVLSICSIAGCKEEEPYSPIASAMNLTLSSLTSVGELTLAVKTESISLPNLETMIVDSRTISRINIRVLDATASLNIPRLSSLKSALNIQGSVSSLNLLSLHDAEDSINIETKHPLNISLPIVEAENLFLTGAIERIDLPSLQAFEDIYINSSLPLDCGPLDKQFSDTADTTSARYACHSTAEEDAGLSARVKVAIGVVVGVVGAGILGGLTFWWTRRGRGMSKSGHVSPIELTDMSHAGDRGEGHWERDLDDEAPPPYTPR